MASKGDKYRQAGAQDIKQKVMNYSLKEKKGKHMEKQKKKQ